MFTSQHLSLDEAQRAMEAVWSSLTNVDSPAAMAIVDADGTLTLCARQDGAPSRMLRRARAKAYTAARLATNTVDFRDNAVKAANRTLDDWGDPEITSLQGGLAIWVDGRVVGAIAMSGNTTMRDEELAGIGLRAMELD